MFKGVKNKRSSATKKWGSFKNVYLNSYTAPYSRGALVTILAVFAFIFSFSTGISAYHRDQVEINTNSTPKGTQLEFPVTNVQLTTGETLVSKDRKTLAMPLIKPSDNPNSTFPKNYKIYAKWYKNKYSVNQKNTAISFVSNGANGDFWLLVHVDEPHNQALVFGLQNDKVFKSNNMLSDEGNTANVDPTNDKSNANFLKNYTERNSKPTQGKQWKISSDPGKKQDFVVFRMNPYSKSNRIVPNNLWSLKDGDFNYTELGTLAYKRVGSKFNGQDIEKVDAEIKNSQLKLADLNNQLNLEKSDAKKQGKKIADEDEQDKDSSDNVIVSETPENIESEKQKIKDLEAKKDQIVEQQDKLKSLSITKSDFLINSNKSKDSKQLFEYLNE